MFESNRPSNIVAEVVRRLTETKTERQQARPPRGQPRSVMNTREDNIHIVEGSSRQLSPFDNRQMKVFEDFD